MTRCLKMNGRDTECSSGVLELGYQCQTRKNPYGKTLVVHPYEHPVTNTIAGGAGGGIP